MNHSIRKRYSSSSNGLESKSNPLGYGSSLLGNMVIGPSVRTIILPYLDIPRVVRLTFDPECPATAHLVLELPALGQTRKAPLVSSAAGLLNLQALGM